MRSRRADLECTRPEDRYGLVYPALSQTGRRATRFARCTGCKATYRPTVVNMSRVSMVKYRSDVTSKMVPKHRLNTRGASELKLEHRPIIRGIS